MFAGVKRLIDSLSLSKSSKYIPHIRDMKTGGEKVMLGAQNVKSTGDAYELVPLAAAVGFGLALVAYMGYYKVVKDPWVMTNKHARHSTFQDQIHYREENLSYGRLWERFKGGSYRIFDKSDINSIYVFNVAYLPRERAILEKFHEAQQKHKAVQPQDVLSSTKD